MSEPNLSQKLRGRPVTAKEAKESARRLVNSHFGNSDRARVQVPANPADDDLIVTDFIIEASDLLTRLEKATELLNAFRRQWLRPRREGRSRSCHEPKIP